MRDPYDILGIKRSATLEEIKAAYRRACKKAHPDVGGSHAAMLELNTAYAFILSELKHTFEKEERAQQQSAPRDNGQQQHGSRHWRDIYKDIDDELEALRRSAEQHEERLRAMRRETWESGDRATWFRLTWADFAAFIRSIARSGLKGLTLLFAALVGIGAVLVEANLVSALIMIGAGIGFVVSLALKSDKGGLMSAGLLLFGIMTIWLPPVRAALIHYPTATISVLLCLALIFKFTSEGGIAGLATGGVLALYMLGVIVADTNQSQVATTTPRPAPTTLPVPQQRAPNPPAPQRVPAPPVPPQPQSPSAPEERTLIASDGAVLKFAAGVIYHLKVRTGFSTSISATQGRVALYAGDTMTRSCTSAMEFPSHSGTGPYQEIAETIRACDGDAVARVASTR